MGDCLYMMLQVAHRGSLYRNGKVLCASGSRDPSASTEYTQGWPSFAKGNASSPIGPHLLAGQALPSLNHLPPMHAVEASLSKTHLKKKNLCINDTLKRLQFPPNSLCIQDKNHGIILPRHSFQTRFF